MSCRCSTICFEALFFWWIATIVVQGSIPCSELLIGQYLCDPLVIDPDTQLPFNCTVRCQVADDIVCEGDDNRTFLKRVESCNNTTSGKRYRTAVLLSIFLGWLGVDRFYLGYPAIGLFKLFTFGFLFIFHLVDVILIALQVVGPADGSQYVISYYGPRVKHWTVNNQTYIDQDL